MSPTTAPFALSRESSQESVVWPCAMPAIAAMPATANIKPISLCAIFLVISP